MIRTFLRSAAAVALLALALPASQAAEPRLEARVGTMVTPRNFPNHSPEDVADMFRVAAQLGSFAVIRVNWNDPNRLDAARAMMELARQQGLEPALELTALKADEIKGAAIDPPKGVEDGGRRVSFANPRVAEAFSRDVLELAQLRPAYFALGTDVNLLELSDPGDHAAYADLVRRLYPQVKKASPETRVYVTFQWEALQRQGGGRAIVDRWRPLDLAAFNSEPRRLYEDRGPGSIPSGYYDRLREFRSGREPLLVEVSWPSDGRNGESEQARFIRDLPKLLSGARPTMVSWTFLHDVKVLMLFTARAGLLNTDGRQKPAFAAFKDLSGDRPAPVASAPAAAPAGNAAALGTIARSSTTTAPRKPGLFGIYTARLDGSDVTLLMSSDDREMSHPRVSPDGKRIVLTRYNKKGRDGKATEEQGYEDTEVMVMNLDGTGLETIVPMKPGVIAANGCWTPDGKSLIWLSTDNDKKSPEIRKIDLDTRRVTRVPTPAGLKTTDPHWEAGKLVFPVKADRGADSLWVMNEDGSNARQVTFPKRTGILPGLYGDFDPKLSPDGTKVAFMRIDGGESWRVVTLDLKSGQEREFTQKGVMEWLPTWSSDGKRLLYVHIDRSKPKEIGLYTMTPEGNDRRMVPLPRGYLYGHSSWFPGDGSGERARIIFTGKVQPGL